MISFTVHTKVKNVIRVKKKNTLIGKAFLAALDKFVSQAIVDSIQALPVSNGTKRFIQTVHEYAAPKKKDKDIIVCRQRIVEKVNELAGSEVLITDAFFHALNSYALAIVALSLQELKGVLLANAYPLVAKSTTDMTPAELASTPTTVDFTEVTTEVPTAPTPVMKLPPMEERKQLIVDFAIDFQNQRLVGKKRFFTAMPEATLRASIRQQVIQSLADCGLLKDGDDDPVLDTITIRNIKDAGKKKGK